MCVVPELFLVDALARQWLVAGTFLVTIFWCSKHVEKPWLLLGLWIRPPTRFVRYSSWDGLNCRTGAISERLRAWLEP
jgi:hypothetical protein